MQPEPWLDLVRVPRRAGICSPASKAKNLDPTHAALKLEKAAGVPTTEGLRSDHARVSGSKTYITSWAGT
eukprot:677429-Rhodomonas_salina.2